MHVEDVVAVVRHEALAPDRLSAGLHHLPRHERHGHRNHLDRQREAAERRDELALVDDADEAPRRGGENLLARERAAAALDQMQVLRRLVGAVDVEVELSARGRGRSP